MFQKCPFWVSGGLKFDNNQGNAMKLFRRILEMKISNRNGRGISHNFAKYLVLNKKCKSSKWHCCQPNCLESWSQSSFCYSWTVRVLKGKPQKASPPSISIKCSLARQKGLLLAGPSSGTMLFSRGPGKLQCKSGDPVVDKAQKSFICGSSGAPVKGIIKMSGYVIKYSGQNVSDVESRYSGSSVRILVHRFHCSN